MELVGIFSRLMTTILVAVLSLLLTVQATCPECTEVDKANTKIVCQNIAHTLIASEETGNTTKVCNALHELMLCVVDKTPQCLDTIGQEYMRYRLTPWMCKLTMEQTLSYQERHRNGCKEKYVNIADFTTTTGKSKVAEVYQNENSCNILSASWCLLQCSLVVLILQYPSLYSNS